MHAGFCCAGARNGPFYVVSEAEAALLDGRRESLVVSTSESPLGARLLAIATRGALNLSPMTAAALADVFLPAILPAVWR
jgi:hypothetical protein